MSVPMEVDEPATEEVPLDLTVKKVDNCAVSEAEVEHDGPAENLTEDESLVPLDLSTRRALPLQLPPSLDVPSPTMAAEHLAPLHGMYADADAAADADAYRRMISTAAVPEYNPFLPVLPLSTDTQFLQHNHIQHQLQHLHMQQQHQLHLQQHLQLQLHQLHTPTPYGGVPLDSALMVSGSPVYEATSSPVRLGSSESNHFPFSGFDCNIFKPAYGFGRYPYYDRMIDGRVTGGAYGGVDMSGNRSDCPPPELSTTCITTAEDHHHSHDHHHQQQQQQDLDREHHPRISACAKDDMGVVDPEEVAAIYKQSDFLWFRHRYMESMRPSRNFDNMRRSRNNNNNNNSSSSSSNNNNNDDGDHGLMPGQQQYDESYVMKRQKNNEAAKRSRHAKQQKYVENQISVMYLTKKVSEMKDIKRRLLSDNSNILAE